MIKVKTFENPFKDNYHVFVESHSTPSFKQEQRPIGKPNEYIYIQDHFGGIGLSNELKYFKLYDDVNNKYISDHIFVLNNLIESNYSVEEIETTLNNVGYINLLEVYFFNTNKEYYNYWLNRKREFNDHEKREPEKRYYDPKLKIDMLPYGNCFNILIDKTGKILFSEFDSLNNPNNPINKVEIYKTDNNYFILSYEGEEILTVKNINSNEVIWKNKYFFDHNFDNNGNRYELYFSDNKSIEKKDNHLIIHSHSYTCYIFFNKDGSYDIKEYDNNINYERISYELLKDSEYFKECKVMANKYNIIKTGF